MRTSKRKNSVTKVWKSKIWDDSFLAFSVGFVVVYSVFSLDAVFTEIFADQNRLICKFPKKTKKLAFSYSKICPLEMIFFAFFPNHLLGPSERYVLDPRTLIGDSKWGFPSMITEQSKMIIIIAIEQMDYRISATISQLSNR